MNVEQNTTWNGLEITGEHVVEEIPGKIGGPDGFEDDAENTLEPAPDEIRSPGP